VTTPTPQDGGRPDAEEVADRLDEPSPHVAPEPPEETGATASERAAAQAVRDLSRPERLDGSAGPA
jgi:hypothetical protein